MRPGLAAAALLILPLRRGSELGGVHGDLTAEGGSEEVVRGLHSFLGLPSHGITSWMA